MHNLSFTFYHKSLNLVVTNLSVENITTKAGIGYQYYDYSQHIRTNGDFLLSFSNHQLSSFLESEAKITSAVAVRAGLRAEHNSVTAATNLNREPLIVSRDKVNDFKSWLDG